MCGYKGNLFATYKAQSSASEQANFSKTQVLKRTDTGSVRMQRSVGRAKDHLIKDTQRYKNIKSENEKHDYMTKFFCAKKKKKTR